MSADFKTLAEMAAATAAANSKLAAEIKAANEKAAAEAAKDQKQK